MNIRKFFSIMLIYRFLYKNKLVKKIYLWIFGYECIHNLHGVVYYMRNNIFFDLHEFKVRNELDKLFESLNEGDKTTTVEPTEVRWLITLHYSVIYCSLVPLI